MIVVEGPDGGGKSTLARQLHQYLGFPVAERVVNQQTEAMTDLRVWTEQNVRAGFQKTIFDRHRLISDPIYSLVKRRLEPRYYDRGWLPAMMDLFYSAHPIIIYCIPPLDVVKQNVFEGDDDNSAVEEHIELIYQGYVARAALDWRAGTTIFDYTVDLEDPEWAVKYVMEELRRRSFHGGRIG